ncbi:MAG TPA: TfuA-like protein [Alphaproteobacteria bacterium]|nr:TfuA-like protein [Alphaproteobacteria bacterium]
MNDIVFVGPTLRPHEIAAVSDAICLPPVAQGDVFRAARRQPSAIGIVDGYFSGAPAVWHKEILWAMSQGIRVYGSASMGALRAAELHRFGMHGIGRIFEAFRDGILEDDDEVAVVHAPAELGFVPMSEPMVNIRATLAEAEANGILSASSRGRLETFGKSLFFPRRNWPTVLAQADNLGIPKIEVETFRDWLRGGAVDQKRDDALEMLAFMAKPSAKSKPFGADAPCANFRFEWTHFWDQLVARHGGDAGGDPPALVPREAVIEELRLEGEEPYRDMRMRAQLRAFAGREARHQGIEASLDAKRAALTRVRRALGLYTRDQLDEWMERNHLTNAGLERLMGNYATSGAVLGVADTTIEAHLLDELRLDGAYERLAARAEEKQATLASRDTGAVMVPPSVELRLWYFANRLRRPMPEDLGEFASELGFSDLADFDSALRREWLYLRAKS